MFSNAFKCEILLKNIHLVIYFGFNIYVASGRLSSDLVDVTYSRWVHIVLNFLGPDSNQGYRIYRDGTLIRFYNLHKDTTYRYRPRDGKIVIGRLWTDIYFKHSSFQLDELLFYNQVLTEAEIDMLSQL